MKKVFVIALLIFVLGIIGKAQTAEGVINGPHVTISNYNKWGSFCNNIVLVQQKNDPVTRHYLYATNYNSSSLYIPGIDKFFNNGDEVIVTNLNLNIKSDGKVGIGTTNPQKGLHVMNDAIIRSTSIGNWDDGLVIYNENNGWAGTVLHRNGTSGNASAKYWYGLRSGTDNFIMMGPIINNSGTSITPSRTDAAFELKCEGSDDRIDYYLPVCYGQNVGIGTTSPDYRLDVVGTIRTQELKVDMQGADFVFEDDYNLRPLDEVEAFVKENKHLPEIAPAAEMQANGVNQSEMNQKLLQKVEELTLYIIEMKKEIVQLKNENPKPKK